MVGRNRVERSMTTARRILAVAIVIGMTFSGMKAEPTRAQSTGFLTEDVADVVAASTVMLSALLLKTENGLEDREPYMECYLGSGSVISDDARFILTNSHVLDLVIVAEDLAASETKNLIDETPGRNVSIRVAELSVWVVDDIEMNPADRRYRAEILEGE